MALAVSLKIPENVLAALSACEIDGTNLTLPAMLPRPEYVAVNKVLEALGGKWNRKAKAHVFAEDPTDLIDNVILTGTYDKPNQHDFFATPPTLAESVIELAQIERGMFVLEPSAGEGALAELAWGKGAAVTVVEIDYKRMKKLRERSWHVSIPGDFLELEPWPFDRVVMNPPFSRQQDIDHVVHAWEFVRPGGRLVAVMSAGASFRVNRKSVEFRALVGLYGKFLPNPADSFRESGTNVNTVTLVMDKPA